MVDGLVARVVRFEPVRRAAEVDAHPSRARDRDLDPGVRLVLHEARRDAERQGRDREGVRAVPADALLAAREIEVDVAGVGGRRLALLERAEPGDERLDGLAVTRPAREPE